MIRALSSTDAPQILRIYQQGLDGGDASFETRAPDWKAWHSKHLPACRLVFEQSGEVVGWAALAATSTRHCYRGVAELSIYVDAEFHRQGIGSSLMSGIIACSEMHNFWTLSASIFPENRATHALHLKHGFRELGRRERIAIHNGRWRDTLLLERRSKKTGV